MFDTEKRREALARAGLLFVSPNLNALYKYARKFGPVAAAYVSAECLLQTNDDTLLLSPQELDVGGHAKEVFHALQFYDPYVYSGKLDDLQQHFYDLQFVHPKIPQVNEFKKAYNSITLDGKLCRLLRITRKSDACYVEHKGQKLPLYYKTFDRNPDYLPCLDRLRKAEIPIEEPLAHIRKGTTEHIITPHLGPSLGNICSWGSEYQKEIKPRKILELLKDRVSAMHNAGVGHGHLHAGNLLLDEQNTIIDLGEMHRISPLPSQFLKDIHIDLLTVRKIAYALHWIEEDVPVEETMTTWADELVDGIIDRYRFTRRTKEKIRNLARY